MKTIDLTKEKIDKIFSDTINQYEYLIELYKEVFPQWKKIKKLVGYPLCNKKTAEYIFEKAIAFDKKHHPEVLHGGLWLNYGFSIDQNMKDWKVKQCAFMEE